MEAIWKKQFSLEEFVAPDQFKSYDELKKRLDYVLGNKGTTRLQDEETVEDERKVAVRASTPAPRGWIRLVILTSMTLKSYFSPMMTMMIHCPTSPNWQNDYKRTYGPSFYGIVMFNRFSVLNCSFIQYIQMILP